MNSDPFGQQQFDLFSKFAQFSRDRQASMKEQQTLADFTTSIGAELDRALSSDIRIYGDRTQAMFQDLVLSLGEYKLFKVEDAGEFYPQDSYKVPDFRIVLLDGQQWLIEVKNVHIKEPFTQERQLMTSDYREKLQRYASATAGELKLAVFWARWRIWTLVSLDDFVDADGGVTLEMKAAAMENDLGTLGDRWIGTRPPLRLRFVADQERTSRVSADGTVRFTVGDVRMYCGEDEVLDPVERNIAWLFVQYGDWEESGPHEIMQGDRLDAFEFRWEPRERMNQGFEVIGALSTMFSHYYSERTTADDGEVVQTRAHPRPDWFEPLLQPDYKGKAMPLWQLTMKPRSYFRSRESGQAAPPPGAV